MAKQFWEIRGYDSTKSIFEKRVPLESFTEKQIEELLKALTARAGLDFEEIVGAYAKRGSRIANALLDVHRNPSRPMLTCGENPYFTAQAVE